MPLTYETNWQCLTCKAKGTASIEDPDEAVFWAEVHQQHQAVSPECHSADRWCFWVAAPPAGQAQPQGAQC